MAAAVLRVQGLISSQSAQHEHTLARVRTHTHTRAHTTYKSVLHMLRAWIFCSNIFCVSFEKFYIGRKLE